MTDIEFYYEPISPRAARRWHSRNCGGKFPGGLTWLFVEDLQNVPKRPCYLVAGENGLTGIVSVGSLPRTAAQAEAA